MRMGGQIHAPAALSPGKRPGTHCIGERVVPTGILSPDLPARSQSLYRLSYRGPQLQIMVHVMLLPINLKVYFTLEQAIEGQRGVQV
jgi:hypothetical protein